MHFPGCLHCEGRCFVGASQDNVIVSREVTTKMALSKVCKAYFTINSPPLGSVSLRLILCRYFIIVRLFESRRLKETPEELRAVRQKWCS